MNKKKLAQFERLLEDPSGLNMTWPDAIGLLKAAGAAVSSKNDRVRIALKDVRGILHRPVGEEYLCAGSARALRRIFLTTSE
ncbi:hypothetical protein [Leptolyngbya sp. 7M]|uniref:hypothetical protein n=1 Tax=Leptolyngbya sp. 7M TaxID=2812896 RepID=UPI001B8CD809|nr:hypothetical protein [Leptolyngbya sp. 7M]QYO61946.1 hypothetical protein JVX88_17600 [Leptolyngbya sp. 7M]